MGRILIVDYTPYKIELETMLAGAGHETTTCESAYEAMAKLKAFDFDLIISEIELPGDNAFDLYNYINTYYPYIPTIMTTGKNMDTFFDRVFHEGIGNVLPKPIKIEELINLSDKLISRTNIFGLHNYIKITGTQKKIRINSSDQIRKAVALILKQIEEWEFTINNKSVLNLILNEMAINAMYHSYGYTKEKEDRKQLKLSEGEYVDMFFARSASGYGITITDYNGKLSKQMILASIHRAIEQEQLILKAAETGEDITDLVSETGRGIDFMRKLSVEYYFVIQKNVKTEIILLFEGTHDAKRENKASLKIIEDIS